MPDGAWKGPDVSVATEAAGRREPRLATIHHVPRVVHTDPEVALLRIMVVDDHPLVREGLSAVLNDDPEFVIVRAVPSGEQALQALTGSTIDVAVVDLSLPGISGIETCGAIRTRLPDVQVVVLTSFPSEIAMLAAFGAGARGFVVKESEPAILRSAVRAAAAGLVYVDPRMAGGLIDLALQTRRNAGPLGLTRRELDVLRRLPRGLTNREIAAEMEVSENTVKRHVRRILRKLDAKDRAEAASIAIRHGLA